MRLPIDLNMDNTHNMDNNNNNNNKKEHKKGGMKYFSTFNKKMGGLSAPPSPGSYAPLKHNNINNNRKHSYPGDSAGPTSPKGGAPASGVGGVAVPKKVLEIGEPLTFKHEAHISQQTGLKTVSIVKDHNIDILDMGIFVNDNNNNNNNTHNNNNNNSNSNNKNKTRRNRVLLKDVLASDEYSWVDDKGNLKQGIGGEALSQSDLEDNAHNNTHNTHNKEKASELSASQFSWVDFSDESQMIRFENILKGIINDRDITDTDGLKKALSPFRLRSD